MGPELDRYGCAVRWLRTLRARWPCDVAPSMTDLDAHLRGTGAPPSSAPSAEVLADLRQAHAAAISFEDLDIEFRNFAVLVSVRQCHGCAGARAGWPQVGRFP